MLLGVAAVGALIGAGAAAVYVRDGKTIQRAKDTVLRLDQVCTGVGRLPDATQFTRMFPDLSPDAGWFYRLFSDGRHATLQYPTAARRSHAPGTPKTSEFTATTYAYEVRLSCESEGPRAVVRRP